MKSFYKVFTIIAILFLTACTKDKINKNKVDKSLTGNDSGKMTAVIKGQTISVTLGNPGDGGYQFNDPHFSTSVLNLVEHSHKDGNSEMTGDFGKDTWIFKASETGTTTLEITASRSWEPNSSVPIFSGQITVK